MRFTARGYRVEIYRFLFFFITNEIATSVECEQPTDNTVMLGLSFTRRDVLPLAAIAAAPLPAFASDEVFVPATTAQSNLRSLNAGARRLTEGDMEGGDLVSELLRRTEANKERNAAAVRATTEANAYQALDGSVSKRMVTDLSGRNLFLDESEVRQLTLQRRLACAPNVMEACRMVEPSRTDLEPLQLPAIKKLECDSSGRDCVFR